MGSLFGLSGSNERNGRQAITAQLTDGLLYSLNYSRKYLSEKYLAPHHDRVFSRQLISVHRLCLSRVEKMLLSRIES